MERFINHAIWISFDLGIGGDYPGLYKWLDNHKALECGDSLAFLGYPLNIKDKDDFLGHLREELSKAVKIRPGDRIYFIRQETVNGAMRPVGTFIFGRRKGTPWEGYGDKSENEGEDGI